MTSNAVSHDPFRGRRVRAEGRFAGHQEPEPAPSDPDVDGSTTAAIPPGGTPIPTDEDPRRAAAVAEAERLGVTVRSNMKTETIEKRVAEAKAEA